MLTDEPEAQRRRQPSSNVTPSVFPSVKRSLNGYSCQSFWTAAYPPILLFPALPTLSPSPPPQRPQTLLTRTPMGPWGICGSSPPQLQSSRLRWRRESKSFPKTLHPSALKFALVRLSRQPPGAFRPNRCLYWCPSLTSSHDLQQLNSCPTRWDQVWSSKISPLDDSHTLFRFLVIVSPLHEHIKQLRFGYCHHNSSAEGDMWLLQCRLPSSQTGG